MTAAGAAAPQAKVENGGIRDYYCGKAEELELDLRDRTANLRRLEAQRNELNAKVRLLREELQLLQEPGSYVGEVVKVMGKKKVLVKVHPEGKYVVDLDKSIDMANVLPTTRVALRNDSYTVRCAEEADGRGLRRAPRRPDPPPPPRRPFRARSCTSCCPPRWTRWCR